jgi:hypothetical protein
MQSSLSRIEVLSIHVFEVGTTYLLKEFTLLVFPYAYIHMLLWFYNLNPFV